MLPNGKVLVAGGVLSSLDYAELYDPASGTWSVTGSLTDERLYHTATLLPNGKVLVAGGMGGQYFASCELYDSTSETWSETGSLAHARSSHTATLLPNGKVLVAGGYESLTSAELYDPASGSWMAIDSLINGRVLHTVTLLSNGEMLVAGGYDDGDYASAELYDPASGNWTATRDMPTGRTDHKAALLQNGKVLVVADWYGGNTAELYDTGLGYESPWQPKITDLRFTGGRRLLLKGSLFQGISQASSGDTQDSSSNYPVVPVRSIDSGEAVFLPVDPDEGWSDTSFSSLPLTHFPHGPALATVFTNGIPSTARYFVVTPCQR